MEDGVEAAYQGRKIREGGGDVVGGLGDVGRPGEGCGLVDGIQEAGEELGSARGRILGLHGETERGRESSCCRRIGDR